MQQTNEYFNQFIPRAFQMRVPYFGHEDSYFLGSGRVGASGTRQGVWSFAIGPDYTSPTLIDREAFALNGQPIPFEMYRLRGSGCFFGMGRAGALVCTLADAVLPENGDPTHRDKLLRLFTAENTGTEEVTVHLTLQLRTGWGGRLQGESAVICAPKGSWCFGNRETLTPKGHLLTVIPDMPGIKADSCPLPGGEEQGTAFTLEAPLNLAPGERFALPVWHCFSEDIAGCDGQGGSGCDPAQPAGLEPLPQPVEFVNRALAEWREWLAIGRYPNAIPDRRLRDGVEALLLCVKMQQNRDGGMIAGIRKYANSYIRDTHGGMRLLNITGHTREVEKLLVNIHTRWQRAGYIPNWWSMGSDAFIGNSFHNDASEVTAYYLFMARDYRNACAGQGAAAAAAAQRTLQEILPSLRWAADAQRDWLAAHGGLMDFNGDETEQYTVTADGQEYGLFGHFGAKDEMGFDMAAASFASTAAAVQSLRWFAEYTGEAAYAHAADRAAETLDNAFWQPEQGSHSWLADGAGPRDTRVTNFLLLPLWLGVTLPHDRQKADALAAVSLRSPVTGFWPNCPGRVEGFCGHTPGLALYAALQVAPGMAGELAQDILNGHLLGCFGTVSEFYGPGGVPNGHNARPFEGGIVGEALVKYAQSLEG